MENKHEEWCRAVSKRIAKIDIYTGKTLEEFGSIYSAAIALGNAKYVSNLSKAINGKLKTCYGFMWIKL